MPRKPKWTQEQLAKMEAIHSELAAQRARHAEIRTEQEKLFKRERELFSQLHGIARGFF